MFTNMKNPLVMSKLTLAQGVKLLDLTDVKSDIVSLECAMVIYLGQIGIHNALATNGKPCLTSL